MITVMIKINILFSYYHSYHYYNDNMLIIFLTERLKQYNCSNNCNQMGH